MAYKFSFAFFVALRETPLKLIHDTLPLGLLSMRTMKITTEYLAVRVVKNFHDHGGPGQYTRKFEKFDRSNQTSMLESAALNSEELPLVACFFDHSWGR